MARPPRPSPEGPKVADPADSQDPAPKGTARRYTRRGRGNRLNTAADDAADIARRQRRAEVFRLRADGITFGRIAEHLGCSETVARDDYHLACREYGQETAGEHKARANSRYDEQVSQLKAQRIQVQRLVVHEPKCRATDCEGCADPRQAVAAHGRLTAIQRAMAQVTHQQAEMNGAVVERVEHTGAGGGPIEVSLADVMDAVRAGVENAGRDERDAGGLH